RGLDVAVAAHAARDRVFHAVAELDGPRESLRERGRPLLEIALQRVGPAARGLDMLHRDVEPAADRRDPVGAHQVRVRAEVDPDLRFLAEALAVLAVAEQLAAQRL